MNNTSFSCVISSLHLRHIDNMPTHRRSRHKAPICKPLQLIAVDICPFLLLSPPVRGRGFGAVECAVQVRPDHVVVVVELGVYHGSLRPGNTRIGHHDIKTAVEVSDYHVDGFFDGFGVFDVYLVGHACETVSSHLLYQK